MARARKDPKDNPNYSRVLDVAARIFDDKGYHEATMQDIADEADLTKGGLYHYLSGKAETLFAINERYLLAGMAEVQEIAERGDASAEEKLRALVVAIAAQHDTFDPDLRVALREFFSAGSDTHARLIVLRDEYETVIKKVITEGIEAGEFVSHDPDLLVKFFFGSLNWMSIWYRPGRYTAEEIGQQFAGLMVRAFVVPR